MIRDVLSQLIIMINYKDSDGDYDTYYEANIKKFRMTKESVTYLTNLTDAIFEEIDELYKDTYSIFAENSLNQSSNRYGYILYMHLVNKEKVYQFEDQFKMSLDLTFVDKYFPYGTKLRYEKIELLVSFLKLICLIGVDLKEESFKSMTTIILKKIISIINTMGISREIPNLPY